MRKIKIICIILCIILISGCSGSIPKQLQLFAMDTVMNLEAYGDGAKEALDNAAKEIDRLDKMLNVDSEDSQAAALNHSGEEGAVMPAEVLEQLNVALQVSERSNGALDLTVYPLVKAWGFPSQQYQVPDSGELASLLKHVDYHNIRVQGDKVALMNGAEIDLGAIAKGYTSQTLMEEFKKAGIKNAMVSLGGNVQVMGGKPDKSPWVIGIQDPKNAEGVIGTLKMNDGAVITSGSYQRYFEKDGVTYHHILDPKTGYPAKSGLLSVTVVTDSGTMGDALSTALFVLGEEKGIEYWRRYGGFDMVMVTEDGRMLATKGLTDKLTPDTKYSYSVIEP